MTNDALDLRPITSVVPLGLNAAEDELGGRGWWPVLAFTDDVRPIVLEFNVN
jgi:hypothetical protein